MVYCYICFYFGFGCVKIVLLVVVFIFEDFLVFLCGIGVNICEVWGMMEILGVVFI